MVRFFLSVPAAEGTFSTVSESVGFCLATMPEEKFCFGLCLSAGSLWHKIPCEHGCVKGKRQTRRLQPTHPKSNTKTFAPA